MRLFLQVLVSCGVVAGVLWFMWRLPRPDTKWFGVAPLLSLASVWSGLMALMASVLLWWVAFPDWLLVVVLLLLDPGSIAAGTLVFWIYRGFGQASDSQAATVDLQRFQARVGLAMGLLAVVIGYVYVMTHKQPFTPVGV